MKLRSQVKAQPAVQEVESHIVEDAMAPVPSSSTLEERVQEMKGADPFPDPFGITDEEVNAVLQAATPTPPVEEAVKPRRRSRSTVETVPAPAIEEPTSEKEISTETLEPSPRVNLPVTNGFPDEMARIVETVFEIDLGSAWKRIHEVLQPQKGGSSARTQLQWIDDRCREGHKIYCALKLEYERYSLDCEATSAAMRAQVSDMLRDEKSSGTRTKTVTEADVRAKMIELYPDEVRDQELKLRKYALAVQHAEHMVKVLSQKSRSLNTEAGKGWGGTSDE